MGKALHQAAIQRQNLIFSGFNIPTGIPMAYELDDNLKPVSREFLGDPEEVAKAAAAVAAQGKAK